MTDELVKTGSMSQFIKRTGIQGLREQARQAMQGVDPLKVPNRLAIGFDDSGSMGESAIKNAKKAVANFLGACSPRDTSVAVVPFSGVESTLGVAAQDLTINYDLINMYLAPLCGISGTPLFETVISMLNKYPITRGIIFSDGMPDYGSPEKAAIALAIKKKIPIDAVYIGDGDNDYLRRLAEKTGGYYLRFDDATSFAKQMKYLSPRYVALLANAEIKAKVERGETI